ncbi:MAG: hypothetical protein LBR79_06395, partial [Oscillospiraceae bacterium]|nr:hypothetical protein [Oscillospiraceae bacterium]
KRQVSHEKSLKNCKKTQNFLDKILGHFYNPAVLCCAVLCCHIILSNKIIAYLSANYCQNCLFLYCDYYSKQFLSTYRVNSSNLTKQLNKFYFGILSTCPG